MTKILLLTLSIIFLFGNMNTETEIDNFDISKLSSEGQTAYKTIIRATHFEDAIIGRGGSLSIYAKNFDILLDEKNADVAFKSILKNGTLPAQLYALSGIYFTDYEHFKREVKKYKNNNEIIETVSGCLIEKEKVSKIVLSNKENVAIIKPTQTLEDWLKDRETSYVIDIANGGYPATFRYFAKKMKKSN